MKRNLETHWEHNFIESMAIFSIFINKPQWDFDPAPSGINGTIAPDFSGHLSWTVRANHSNGEWCGHGRSPWILSSPLPVGRTCLPPEMGTSGFCQCELRCSKRTTVMWQWLWRNPELRWSNGSLHTVLLGGKHNQQKPRAWRLVEMAVGTRNDPGRKNKRKPEFLKKLRLSWISIRKGII